MTIMSVKIHVLAQNLAYSDLEAKARFPDVTAVDIYPKYTRIVYSVNWFEYSIHNMFPTVIITLKPEFL